MEGHEGDLAGVVELVAHLRADDDLDRHVVRFRQVAHRGTRGQLRVDLAAIGDEWHVGEVHRVVGGVVDAERAVLKRGKFLADLLVFIEVDEPRPRPDRTPLRRVMQPDVPCPRPAHREPPQHDPAFVDSVAADHIGQGLEHVGLSGIAISVVATTEDIQLEVRLARRSRFALVLGEERDFALLAPAMQFDVERQPVGAFFDVALGEGQGVRLSGAVDARPIAQDGATGRLAPGGFASPENFNSMFGESHNRPSQCRRVLFGQLFEPD